MSYQGLPVAEKQKLKVGYMRLTDSAPLILAKELGLYQQHGLEVELIREVSWANLRDRLVSGDLDAAQMLAPLPMMTTYGAGGLRAEILTGLVLSLNGNAITLASKLRSELGIDDVAGQQETVLSISRRLADWLGRQSRKPALTFATVHLFSMHTIQLRMWLAAGGLDPDHDVRIIVLPPAQMCDSLARGIIDGYCVGEPWNTLAVQQGAGFVASSSYQIWNNAPEKVLAVTGYWHQSCPGAHLRLRLALMESCRLLAEKTTRRQAAALLSDPAWLDMPEHILLPSLSGEFRCHRQEPASLLQDFHVFWSYQACFPWRSSARQMLDYFDFALAKALDEEQKQSLVQTCYRTDLYREAARYMGVPSPSSDYKSDGLHSGEWTLEAGITMGADLMLWKPV